MSFNKVILQGNLTRDPEMRYTPTGTAVVKFGLALNRTWTQNGEKKESVTFVDVDAFGKTAELIGQHFRKGSPILIEGRLETSSWEDKATGQKRSKLGVIAEGFSFIGGKAEGAPEPQREAPQAQRPMSKVVGGEPQDETEPPF